MVTVAIFALVVLAACGSGAGEEEAHEQVTRVPVMSDAAAQATREAASGATPGAGGEAGEAAMEVTVVSNDIFFEPTELTIPANTNVKFILPNDGAAAHDFSIDELGIKEAIAPGATKQVIVNAPAGAYEYYCSVPGHKQAGMVGTLTVTEDASAAPAASSATEAGATPLASPAAATGEATPVAGSSAAATPGAATPVAEGAPADQIQIVADDIFFTPEDVTIPADREVTLTLRNEGVAAHNFSIDALGIDVPLPPGESTEVTINAPAGEYEYYCTEPGHKDIGMVGTLIVTADAAAAPAVSPDEGVPALEAAADADAAAPAAEEDASAAASADAATVVSHDIYFDPKELAIPADTDVTVSLPNEGVTLHNFAIDELGIDIDIDPGATQEVVINAPAGAYEYYCNVPGHKAAGMVGTLTVG